MNRPLLENIYNKSVEESIKKSMDKNQNTAWVWEEAMAINTLKELKYNLAINHHALTLEQINIINDTFGKIL